VQEDGLRARSSSSGKAIPLSSPRRLALIVAILVSKVAPGVTLRSSYWLRWRRVRRKSPLWYLLSRTCPLPL
jgi:hypothetical protein